MDRNRNTPGSKAATDDAPVAKRLQRLARIEQQRIETERRLPVPQNAQTPSTVVDDGESEPSHQQLVESVDLLRAFCGELKHQSAYLSVRLTHAKSSAEAEFVVGKVDEAKFWDSKPDWGAISLLRSIRIGNVRENYECTKGVAEIVETGEVLGRPADLRAHLNDKLLAEIAQAVGRWRADGDSHIRDERGGKEELPLNLAILQSELLLNGLLEHLAAAHGVRTKLAAVIGRLYKLRMHYGLEDDWPSVVLDANFAWLTPVAQVLRVHDLVRNAQAQLQRYAEEQGAEAKLYESELQQAEANADRLADDAFYDVGLEKRLEEDVSESEDEYYHYHGRASSAEEAAAVLTECLISLDAVIPDVTVALAARRGRSIAEQDSSTHQGWQFND